MQTFGRILDQDIQNLISHCDIVAEINENVKLTKKGKYFWGRCPFHEEKTPSFKVDHETQLYYCFGCHEGGNIFTFLSKSQNMDFKEAVEYLAAKHGITLRRSATEGKTYNKLERLFKLNEQARKFYSSVLFSDKGKKALEYATGRGFTEDTIRSFDLGLAPNTENSLLFTLKKAGFSSDEAITCGLAKSYNGREKDFFISRLIFPIRDMQGKVVAFGGRALSSSGPKYLNTPETDIFHKSHTLYGLFQAKKEISKKSSVLVVEGYTDVLALYQAGIPNTVATLGTAVTVNHLKLLNRFADKIILVFDGDAAGLAAAERVIGLEADTQNIYVITLPENQDPADYVQSQKLEGFESILKSARPLPEFCIDAVISRFTINNYQSKLKAAKAAIAILAKLDDPVAFSVNRKLLAEKIGIEEKSIIFSDPNPKDGAAKRRPEPVMPLTDAGEKAQRELIKLFLQDKDCSKYQDFLDEDDFQNEMYREIFSVLKKTSCGKKVNELINEVENKIIKNMVARLAIEEIESDNLDSYCFALLNKLKELSLERKITGLKARLQKMNPLKELEYNGLFKTLIDLEAQKRDLFSASIGG